MTGASKAGMALAVCVAASLCLTTLVLANGGPFVVAYPDGDPAAKGVLARLGPDLKPARETRLRVVKEDLTVTFGRDPARRVEDRETPPLSFISAAYTIENPTDEEVQVDFGFPILRGVYLQPGFMIPRPDIAVVVGDKHAKVHIISNSAIYGIIRQSARRAIDRGLAADRVLADLVSDVREAGPAGPEAARAALASYLTDTLKWNERDAALMVEYASLDIAEAKTHPRDRSWGAWTSDGQLNELMQANLGALAAIGEQKTTQLFAQLASRFEPDTAAAYETIFTAWGGDVRERSVDLITGELRPREITVDPANREWSGWADPTIYTRVDYFDENAEITEAEKASCKAVLKNLPVIFTFAPMNLLYYQATFPPNETSQLTVSYSQYAYRDTREPASYQLAYVVHPASMWDEFGPINVEVAVPDGVPFRASIACEQEATEEREPPAPGSVVKPEETVGYDIYRTTLKEKTGELFLAVNAEKWGERMQVEEDVALKQPEG